MEPFISEIRLFTWRYVPAGGWLPCDGAALDPRQYQALFALIGTTYGGNGTTTFNLPDLRGRVPVCANQGRAQLQPATTTYARGNTGGLEGVTLTVAQTPSHMHLVNATATTFANAATLASNLPGIAKGSPGFTAQNIYAMPGGPTAVLANDTVSTYGGGMPHENMQPFLVLNFCIAYQGIWPQRP